MNILQKHEGEIKGILSTFDRMIFKGHMTPFFANGNINYYLWKKQVLLKNFISHVKNLSKKITENAEEIAELENRPYQYISTHKISKERYAKKIMIEDNIKEGLICIFRAVEPCKSFTVRGNKKTKKLEIIRTDTKCLHFYFYYIDKEFGFMHVRLQSWFPFEIQIYINGREYLSKKLDKSGIKYNRYENSFTEIDNLKKAQKIADQIANKKWRRPFDKMAKKVNPILNDFISIFNKGYYWCLDQCEYATDVMFKNRKYLTKIYPDLIEHALIGFNCEDVMVFLGRKLHGNFKGEIISDIKRRPQGVRIKHRMKQNSIKMYDKWSILRIETTINQPREFKIYRNVERKGQSVMAWIPMGKGISNIYRYAQVSKASNKRYLEALSSAKNISEVISELEKITQPVSNSKNRYSGINPISKNIGKVFSAVLDGSTSINGFQNKNIKEKLYPLIPADEKIKYSARITRLLGKLRAHGLIKKINRSSKYLVTKKGYRIMQAALKITKKEFPKFLMTA